MSKHPKKTKKQLLIKKDKVKKLSEAELSEATGGLSGCRDSMSLATAACCSQ